MFILKFKNLKLYKKFNRGLAYIFTFILPLFKFVIKYYYYEQLK